MSLINEALAAHSAQFGKSPAIHAAAPGRVNLIGEHTDYNNGFVLPMALDRRTLFFGGPNGTSKATLVAPHFGESIEIDLTQPLRPGKPSWANYVIGVMAGFQAAGATIPGYEAVILSDVPMGGGLSSSAALEVSAAIFLEALCQHPMPPETIALLCQKAENDFAGVPCGVMDQFISTCGRAGHALLLDCASLETRHIPFANDSVSLLIVNSMVKHALADSAYAKRRATCEAAAAALGVASLRDATLADLERVILDDETHRRARHVITEISRTLQAADCLASGDWAMLGHLMDQSHVSLRDDYEVSCAELDWLVAEAKRIPSADAVFGARMTGGGFGGSMIVLAKADAVAQVQQELCAAYAAWSGRSADSLISLPSAGASLLEL